MKKQIIFFLQTVFLVLFLHGNVSDIISKKLISFGFNKNTDFTIIGNIDSKYLIVHASYCFQSASIVHVSNKLVIFENNDIRGFYYGINLIPRISGNKLIFDCEKEYGNSIDFSNGIPNEILIDGEIHIFATKL